MFEILIGFLGLCFLPCTYRLIRGPSLGDRLLATDLMLILVMALFCVQFVREGQSFYLELIMIVALAAFVATLAFCRAMLRRSM